VQSAPHQYTSAQLLAKAASIWFNLSALLALTQRNTNHMITVRWALMYMSLFLSKSDQIWRSLPAFLMVT